MLSMFPKVKQMGVVLDHVACMNHDQLVLVDKPRPDVTRGLGWAFENHYWPYLSPWINTLRDFRKGAIQHDLLVCCFFFAFDITWHKQYFYLSLWESKVVVSSHTLKHNQKLNCTYTASRYSKLWNTHTHTHTEWERDPHTPTHIPGLSSCMHNCIGQKLIPSTPKLTLNNIIWKTKT